MDLSSLDSLAEFVSSSPWAYAVIFSIAALDAVFPLVPSESTLITAGVIAAVGDLSLALVIATGAAGAFAGDSSAFGLGRAADSKLRRLVFAGRSGGRRLAFVERAFAARAGSLILVGRFVPGGRTAVMFTAGATSFPYGRFVRLATGAAVAWSVYASLLGYAGGRVFEDEPLLGLVLGFALAATLVAIVEAARRWRGGLLRVGLLWRTRSTSEDARGRQRGKGRSRWRTSSASSTTTPWTAIRRPTRAMGSRRSSATPTARPRPRPSGSTSRPAPCSEACRASSG